jgi:rhodanese-related sulfurtransferase
MGDTLGEGRNRPIALICARGNRSSLASSALAEAGYTQVYNIREGMLGSPDGPGWLARGLPTDPCSTC